VKIEHIESIQAGRWMFVRLHTDSGIVGTGEAGVHAYPEAVRGIIDAWEPHLVGQDPLRIEHHWQTLYRNLHFRGAVIGAALSAVDIALWDIAGKHFGCPSYQLLGGRCRDLVRLYMHVGGDTIEELVAAAGAAVDDGFTAVRFTPTPPGFTSMRYAELIGQIVERVAAVRQAVGPNVDLCVELHRRLDPHHAFGLCRELAQFRPFFVEDPIVPDSIQNMGVLQRQIDVPIATGERLHSVFEFNELLVAGGCRFVRPDVCLAGGLSSAKKIAAIAEAYHVGVVPHNPLSPISTAACVQLDACIPNFALQEYTGEDMSPKRELLVEPLVRRGGYLEVPDRPGIGVELDMDVVRALAPTRRAVPAVVHEDGSVADI
jgi:galactonate dehydratase